MINIKVKSKIIINSDGIIQYLSIIHPIGDECFLIEQKINENGETEYYTNQIQEGSIGVNTTGTIKYGDEDART